MPQFAISGAAPLARVLNSERPFTPRAMHVTLLIPEAMSLAAAIPEEAAALRARALETALARADRHGEATADRGAWLCRAFGVASQRDWPVAPLMRAYDAGEAPADMGPAYFLRAEPVHLRADRARLVLAQRVDDLTADEARALAADLDAHFAADGCALESWPAGRWYLRVPEAPHISTTPLARALGHSVQPLLPQGEDALAWHRLINEAQMLLHHHPVNAAREERGVPVVNSLWLWGGGTAPAPEPQDVLFDSVYADDALAHAAAHAAQRPGHALPANATALLEARAAQERTLVILDAAERAAVQADPGAWQQALDGVDRAWIAPLLEALRGGRLTALTLVLPDAGNGIEAVLTRGAIRRWWRRRVPLARYAGKAA